MKMLYPGTVLAQIWLVLGAFLMFVLMGGSAAYAAAPLAGTQIGNQATATYTDALNLSQTATSNLVQTTVAPVGSYSLTADNTKTASAGTIVYMPHTVTNLGNQADTFKLTLTEGDGATSYFSNYQIFADVAGNGVPDSQTPLCSGAACKDFVTPSVASGDRYSFVVALTVSGSAGTTGEGFVTVSASPGTPENYSAISISNKDIVKIAATSAFSLTKVVSPSAGVVGASATYTLSYRNNGVAAGPIYLKDVIGSGDTVGLAYTADSAKWNATTALSDIGGKVAGIDYQAKTVGGVTTIEAVIVNVAPGSSGTISFSVIVENSAVPGISSTSNIVKYSDGAIACKTIADCSAASLSLTQSNVAAFTTIPNYGLVANNGANKGGVPDKGDGKPEGVDLVQISNAAPGMTVALDNPGAGQRVTIWNTGNQDDSYKIEIEDAQNTQKFPAGTAFQFFKEDGLTPLLDTTGDGKVDTGPVTAGKSVVIVVKATIPANACSNGTCPTGPFNVKLNATSTFDSRKSDVVFASVKVLSVPSVVLSNDKEGNKAGTDSPKVTVNVAPGGSAVFDLWAKNSGSAVDSYDLSSSASNNFSPVVALPAGWSVQFRSFDGTECSATGGSVIGKIGPLTAGSQIHFCAIVTSAPNSTVGVTNVYFGANSVQTGTFSALLDAVVVNQHTNLGLTPSNTGQVNPGGTIVYSHTLTNAGNVSCDGKFTAALSESLANQGWMAVVYKDVDGSGTIGPDDTVISASGLDGPLLPGASVKLLVKVFAPANAPVGAIDNLTLTMTDTGASACGTAVTTDMSTVISGQLKIIKQQALWSGCTGAEPRNFGTEGIAAKPGDCIVYQTTVTNQGATAATAVKINDVTPAYTGFVRSPTCNPGIANPSSGTPGAGGVPQSCDVGTLSAGGKAVMTMVVQVNK